MPCASSRWLKSRGRRTGPGGDPAGSGARVSRARVVGVAARSPAVPGGTVIELPVAWWRALARWSGCRGGGASGGAVVGCGSAAGSSGPVGRVARSKPGWAAWANPISSRAILPTPAAGHRGGVRRPSRPAGRLSRRAGPLAVDGIAFSSCGPRAAELRISIDGVRRRSKDPRTDPAADQGCGTVAGAACAAGWSMAGGPRRGGTSRVGGGDPDHQRQHDRQAATDRRRRSTSRLPAGHATTAMAASQTWPSTCTVISTTQTPRAGLRGGQQQAGSGGTDQDERDPVASNARVDQDDQRITRSGSGGGLAAVQGAPPV